MAPCLHKSESFGNALVIKQHVFVYGIEGDADAFLFFSAASDPQATQGHHRPLADQTSAHGSALQSVLSCSFHPTDARTTFRLQ